MIAEQFNNIVSVIRNHHGLSKDCMKQLEEKFSHISHDTLFSILSQEYQQRMKNNHVQLQTNKPTYCNMYKTALKLGEPPGKIVRIAERSDIAPCLMAKIILHDYLEKGVDCDEQWRMNVNVYLRDTTLIPDPDLAYEVFLCTLCDNMYSPLTEVMRSSLGQQYEIKLYREAERLGLAFRDEEYLRKHGYDKTPDCKLDVPVVVDGFIVNWIESKALFGNEDSHRDYMKNQYLSYWNRFGSGLVIYWFGFLDTIVDPNNKKFIIRDFLPKNITHMTPPNFVLFDEESNKDQ